ncbi:MAG: hypothetical protein AAFU71_11355 [Cyanobacteria bacterium J06632_22]
MSKAKTEAKMTTIFWVGIGLMIFTNLERLKAVEPQTAYGFLIIAAACMFPVYLWCEGKVGGMPVFPFFSLTYLWTFCLPLLSENPNVLQYSGAEHLQAATTVAVFLLSGTAIWYQIVKTSKAPRSYLALGTQGAETFFIGVVLAGAFINMYLIGGWTGIPDKLFTILRNAILGLSFLGIFILAYRSGSGDLGQVKGRFFFACLCLNILTAAAGLTLKTALTLFLLSVIAFVVGGKRLPTLPLILGLVALLPLHYGKHPMRAKYWEGPAHYVQPWEYPAWFGEWWGHALKEINHEQVRYEVEEEEKESFVERSSIIHILMMAQEKIPSQFPHLNGETYSYVLILMIPRAFYPAKPVSHIGTHTLNIHIKRQTPEQTEKTTIAWGLLPEAYANFGVLGCMGVGGFLGLFYALATRLSIGTSAFSTRSMFSVLVLSFALASTEWTAGVYSAALFQGTVPVVAMSVLMRVRRSGKPKRRLTSPRRRVSASKSQRKLR